MLQKPRPLLLPLQSSAAASVKATEDAPRNLKFPIVIDERLTATTSMEICLLNSRQMPLLRCLLIRRRADAISFYEGSGRYASQHNLRNPLRLRPCNAGS